MNTYTVNSRHILCEERTQIKKRAEHCHQILHLKNPFIHVKRKQTKLNFPLTLVVFYHADNLALLRDFFFILYFG